MITSTTVTNTVSSVLSRFFGNTGYPKLNRTERAAVEQAYSRFAAEHGQWVAALFDKSFLRNHGCEVIADYMHGLQSRSQAAAELARRWDLQIGPATTPVRKRRIADAVPVAAAFLALLDAPAATDGTADHRSHGSDGVIHIALSGKLDHRGYLAVLTRMDNQISRSEENASPRLVIDASDLESIGLSGVYTLHAMAAALRNDSYPDPDTGLAGLRKLAERNIAAGRNEDAVIAGSSAAVQAKLRQAGLDRVYTLSH